MRKFTTELDVRFIGEYQFMLLSDLVYESNKYIITCIKGFISDGASIPKSAWSIVGCPFGELYSKAAVLHDLLYRSGILSKDECDYLFYEAMLSCGVDRTKAKTMYYAVKEFGSSSYANYDKLSYNREFIKLELK